MKTVKTIMLALLSITLVISGFVYQIIIGTNMTITDDVFINTTIKESKLVREAHEYFIKQMPVSIIGNSVGRKITIDDMEIEIDFEKYTPLVANSFGRAFNPVWLEQSIFTVVTDMVTYIKGESGRIETIIDLRENKQVLRGYLINDFNKIISDYGLDDYITTSEVENTVDGVLRSGEFPNQIEISGLINSDLQANFKQVAEMKKYVIYLPFVFFGLIIILMMILAGPGKGLIWFGASIVLSFLLFFMTTWFISINYSDKLTSIINDIVPLSPYVISTITNRVIQKLRISSGYFVFAGILFFIAGMAINIKITNDVENEYD